VVHVCLTGVTYAEEGNGTVLVNVAAGEEWDVLVLDATSRGLWGIENLSGIPGRVGAAPVQNINAYGVSVGDVVVRVGTYHKETGECVSFTHDECRLGYRDSFFKTSEGSAYIITEVTFRLSTARDVHTAYRSSSQSIERYLTEKGITEPAPGDIREAVLQARRNIGMLPGMYQSAGSFFKNTIVTGGDFARIERVVAERHREKGEKLSPWHWNLPDGTVKISTAFLMECTPYNKTDFRGKTFKGTVGISPLHTLSIVNAGGATAEAVRAFGDEIVRAVEGEFGVRIEPEVCFL
jgi:UDP-N-acetylmuramate dehydrogenase